MPGPLRKRRARAEATRRGDSAPAKSQSAVSTRTQILMGASEAFGAKGYADTSVEDILQASGVARRTFYRTFRSKADVFEQLFETATLMFIQSTRTAADLGKTPEEKIANCIDVYLAMPRNAGPIFYVFQAEVMRPGSTIALRRSAVIDQLVDMLGRGYREHTGREPDALVLRGVIAALESISSHVHMRTEGTDEDLAKARKAMLHIVSTALADDGPE